LALRTDGSAAFALTSGRARKSTLAGFAAIVISSPVAGLRPFALLRGGLHARGQLHESADPQALGFCDLLENHVLSTIIGIPQM
jgi:hypothetical protein